MKFNISPALQKLKKIKKGMCCQKFVCNLTSTVSGFQGHLLSLSHNALWWQIQHLFSLCLVLGNSSYCSSY